MKYVILLFLFIAPTVALAELTGENRERFERAIETAINSADDLTERILYRYWTQIYLGTNEEELIIRELKSAPLKNLFHILHSRNYQIADLMRQSKIQGVSDPIFNYLLSLLGQSTCVLKKEVEKICDALPLAEQIGKLLESPEEWLASAVNSLNSDRDPVGKAIVIGSIFKSYEYSKTATFYYLEENFVKKSISLLESNEFDQMRRNAILFSLLEKFQINQNSDKNRLMKIRNKLAGALQQAQRMIEQGLVLPPVIGPTEVDIQGEGDFLTRQIGWSDTRTNYDRCFSATYFKRKSFSPTSSYTLFV